MTLDCAPATSADLLDTGDYATVAMDGSEEDWRTFAAQGVLGKTGIALEGLAAFEEAEARFYEGVAYWIGGDDAAAEEVLARVPDPHAQSLLALIRKPLIRVLTQFPSDRQAPWGLLAATDHDPKFELRNIGFHPEDVPNSAHADVRSFYDAGFPPDFYACLMAEWQLLPTNLRDLPCPIIATTTDYDFHIQTLYPWLQIFDELITESAQQRRDLRGLVAAPVSVYSKVSGLDTQLPPIPARPRSTDLFFSGTILHPFHPDKAQLLYQVLSQPHVATRINNGFIDFSEYCALLGSSKIVPTYVRYAGCIPTRGLEALSMGCAVIVQRGCSLTLYLGEDAGVCTYDPEQGDLPAVIRRVLDRWPDYARRARRGAEIVRREFAQPKVGSQYLRFLTFLAARPRGPRRTQPIQLLAQKSASLWQGWPQMEIAVRDSILAHNLAQGQALLEAGQEAGATVYLGLTRELTLDLAARERLGLDRETTLQPLLERATNLYRTALPLFPRLLALRFNFVRLCMHYGGESHLQEAQQVAQQTLQEPISEWQLGPMDDLYGWNFHPEWFNYRRYLTLVVRQLSGAEGTTSERVRLVLAALAHYVGRRSTLRIGWLEQSVELDPEFALYRFHLAQALLERGEPGQKARAGALLAELAEGSFVWPQAIDLLKALKAGVQLFRCSGVQNNAADLCSEAKSLQSDCPEWERLVQAKRRFAAGTQYEAAGWQPAGIEAPSEGANSCALPEPGAAARPQIGSANPNSASRSSALYDIATPLNLWPYQLPAGYDTEAREIGALLDALEYAGYTPSLQLYRRQSGRDCAPVTHEARLLARLQSPPPGSCQISYLPPPFCRRREDSSALVGRVRCDAQGLPPTWVQACNQLDAVWVPSVFHLNVCAQAGVRPELLRVVPTSLVTAHFSPEVKPLPISGARDFNFLACCEFSPLSGWDLMLTAFVQEFTAQDKVALILHPQPLSGISLPRLQQQVVGCIQQALQGRTAQMPAVVLQTEAVAEESLPNLYRAAGCFVSVERGVGGGRSCLEAMAMGLPVIATGWGANLDLLSECSGFLVEAQESEVPVSVLKALPLLRGCRWAEPSLAHLRRQLRCVYEQQERAAETGQRGRAAVMTRHDYTRVAEALAAELARLQTHTALGAEAATLSHSLCLDVLV